MRTVEGNSNPGILVDSILALVLPMFGKVAPPVDHHPTHLAISGAAKCKWEVEKGQLVAVAHTLASD